MPARKSAPRKNQKESGDGRTTAVFSIASCLNDIGANMVQPLWPLFVTSVLGAPMSFLGLLDGLGEAISHSVRLPSGYLSDKLRRHKPFVWLGYLFGGFSRIGYALSTAAGWLIPFKILDRLGKLRDPPRDAMIAEKLPPNKRGRAFGILNAADRFGATVGPLFALLLFAAMGFRDLFLLAAVPSLFGAALVFIFIRERKHKKKIFHYRLGRMPSSLKFLTATSGLFALSWFSISFMIVYATQYISIEYAALLFFVMALISSVVSVPAGKLSDSIGRKPVLILGYGLWFLVCAAVLLVGTLDLLECLVIFGVYGLHYGIMNTVQSPFVSDITKTAERATSIGVFQMVFGLMTLPASIIAGVLWDVVSPSAPFLFGAAVSAVSIFLFAALVKEKK